MVNVLPRDPCPNALDQPAGQSVRQDYVTRSGTLVHLWKQDPFFRASKRMVNDRKLLGRIFHGGWSIFRSKARTDTLDGITREGHVFLCWSYYFSYIWIIFLNFLVIWNRNRIRLFRNYRRSCGNLRTSLDEENGTEIDFWSLSKIYATVWNLRSNLISQNLMTIRNKF